MKGVAIKRTITQGGRGNLKDLIRKPKFWLVIGLIVVFGVVSSFEEAYEIYEEVFALALLAVLYFLPSVLARKEHNARSVFVINLLLGWTVIGWIVALGMAVTNPRPMPTSQAVGVPALDDSRSGKTVGLIVLLLIVWMLGLAGIGFIGLNASGGKCPPQDIGCGQLTVVSTVCNLLEVVCLVLAIVLLARRRPSWWQAGFWGLVLMMLLVIPFGGDAVYWRLLL